LKIKLTNAEKRDDFAMIEPSQRFGSAAGKTPYINLSFFTTSSNPSHDKLLA
jgi:hypothetical protein